MRTNLIAGFIFATTSVAFAQSFNEIRIQQTGIDTQIYAEIKGIAGTDMSAYSLLVIGNDDFATPPAQNGYIESVIQLSGVIPASGYYVVAEPSYSLTTPDLFSFLDFQSDNNKTYLLVNGFTGVVGDIVDSDSNGTIDTTFWTSISSSVAFVASATQDGLFSDYVYSTTKVGPDGGYFPSKAQVCEDSGVWNLGFAEVSLTSDTPGAANTGCSSSNVVVQLNEVRIDQQGTDNDEFVELSGQPGADLSALTYIVIGDGTTITKSGVIECIMPLTGQIMPADGLFLITNKASGQDGIAFGATGDLQSTAMVFENSDNVTHLIVRTFTGTLAQDLDTNDDGVLDATPWTSVVDGLAICKTTAAAPTGTDEWWYTPVVEEGSFVPRSKPDALFVASHNYRCSPQGSWKVGFFDPVAAGSANLDSPGAVNPECSNCGSGAGSCFTTHDDPGCNNANCCATVCSIIPACCVTAWDSACSDSAFLNCLQGGNPPAIQLSEIRTFDEPTRNNNLPLNQYVEISGPANASLNGVTLVIIGAGGTPYDYRGFVDSSLKLDGLQLDSSGRFLITENNFNIPGVTPNLNSGGGLVFDKTGTITVLLAWNFYGSTTSDLDVLNDGVLDSTPWISLIDSMSLTDGNTDPLTSGAAYSTTVVGPHNYIGIDRLPEHAYRCTTTETWTMGQSEYTVYYDTPRAANASCSLPQIFNCGDSGAGDCLTAHDNAHCNNMPCCEAVCNVVPSCCSVIWDETCVAATATLADCGGGLPAFYLSEARFDEVTAGTTDANEYIEIAGTPGEPLDGRTVLILGEGSTTVGGVTTNLKSGAIETVISLDGQVMGETGYFVITLKTVNSTTGEIIQDGVALGYPGDLQVATLNMENDDNLTVMLVEGFTGLLNTDLDTDDNGTLDSTPWTSLIDSISIVKTVRAAPISTTEEWWYAARIPPLKDGIAMHIYRCFPDNLWWAGVRDITDPNTITDRLGQGNLSCPGNGSECFGDLDFSGEVDTGDVALVLLDTGACSGCPSDLDGSGEVDSGDVSLILLSTGVCP